MIKASIFGVNSGEQAENIPCDMVCPELPYNGKNNFWEKSCKLKQLMPSMADTCYPECKHKIVKPIGVKREPKFAKIPKKELPQLRKLILKLRAKGLTNIKIGEKLGYSPATIHRHGAIARLEQQLKIGEK